MRRLARLARAQRALADLRAREHASAAEAQAESEAAAGAIVEALNGDSPLHGLLTGMMADALTRNAVATVRLGRETAAAAQAQRHESVRADALERRASEASDAASKLAARRALEALLSRAPGPR